MGLCSLALSAQSAVDSLKTYPFRGHFHNAENNLHVYLDLYNLSLEAPGFGFLGKVGGYMNGRIYGTWMLTESTIKKKKAILRFSNDIGSDSQTVEFSFLNDSTFHFRTVGGNALRMAVKRKLEKYPGEMEMKRVR